MLDTLESVLMALPSVLLTRISVLITCFSPADTALLLSAASYLIDRVVSAQHSLVERESVLVCE